MQPTAPADRGAEPPRCRREGEAAGLVVPSFDIVRVEPTGDAVIAGVAAPGATVELLDGTRPVATAVANKAGDWAMALDTPLPKAPMTSPSGQPPRTRPP